MNVYQDLDIKTKIIDVNAKFLGIPTETLMKNAGKGVADELIKKYGKEKSYNFICGLGNNGGDGFATALELARSGVKKINIYLLGFSEKIKTDVAAQMWKELEESIYVKNGTIKFIENTTSGEIEEADITVECILGTGIKGGLSKKYKEILSVISKQETKMVAIDSPVPGYNPDIVLSLGYPKAKDAIVIDIGIPERAKKFCGPGDVKVLLEPKSTSYKYQNGELLVFGGSDKFHGAPLMAIKVASKLIGSVFFYSTPENRELTTSFKVDVAEFIALNDNNLEKYAEYAGAFLFGPGLEANLPSRAIIKELLKRHPKKPTVLDAYAITVAKEKEDFLKDKIITPHSGEIRHFFEDKEIPKNPKKLEKVLIDFAKKHECYIILTGKRDLLIHKNGDVAYNDTGNQGMAKGGTGDILAGLIAALITQNDPWVAMRAAAFINGKAGDNLYYKYGYNYSATDLITEIQKVIKWCKEF